MKITCQACQSKYTIADDKIQGKVAKIRCRKCGATVLVDASSGGGAQGNGEGANDIWLVSVSDGDQRTMQLSEVIDAYNSGIIVGDTFLWKEGMGDWQALSEIGEIVTALNEANASAAAVAEPPPMAYTPPVAYSPPAVAMAARRETARGRGDLFGGGVVEEEVATSAPHVSGRGGGSSAFGGGGGGGDAGTQRSGLTGARDEHSVLFSLNALTGGTPAAPSVPVASSSSRNEDSGLIDLNALAKAQQQSKPAEEVAALAAPTPFLFPAALGTIEPAHTPDAQKKKSAMPMFIGGGLVLAGIVIASAIFVGGKKEEPTTLPAAGTSSIAAAPPTPPPPVVDPAPVDSAPAVASAKVATKKPGGGGARKASPSTGPATPALPAPAPKAKSPCGCAGGDLQCQIRCSATGH